MQENFNAIIQGEIPILVDFFAEWCGPCKVMKPVLEDLKKELGASIRILKIDVDKNPQIASTYQIQGVPTLMVFKNGQMKWRESGAKGLSELLTVIRSVH